MNDRKTPDPPPPGRLTPRTRDPIRSIPAKSLGAPLPPKPGGRHSGKSIDLYSYQGYRHWIDKVRGNWDDKK